MATRGTLYVTPGSLRQLGENMRTMKREIALKIARSATNAGAQVIKKRAIRHIETSPSVETGSLRDAVVVKRATKAETAPLTSVHLVAVRQRQTGRKTKTKQPTAPHAHFVEFGTVHMPAEPFMRPAFDEGKEDALNAITEKLADGIEKVAGTLPT